MLEVTLLEVEVKQLRSELEIQEGVISQKEIAKGEMGEQIRGKGSPKLFRTQSQGERARKIKYWVEGYGGGARAQGRRVRSGNYGTQ